MVITETSYVIKGIDCDLENTMTVVSPKDETCVSLHPGDFQVQESRPAAGLLRLGILVELASHGGLFSCEIRRLSNRLTRRWDVRPCGLWQVGAGRSMTRILHVVRSRQ